MSHSSPCRVPQHGGEFRSNKKSSNKEKRKPTKADRSVTFNPLPLCSCKEYRGSARRSRGVRIQANAQTPIRLYRAVKTQGRRRKKGEDRPSGASSADPDGDRGDEPNSPITAGASEFVLLAVEKNEQAQTSFFNPSVTT